MVPVRTRRVNSYSASTLLKRQGGRILLEADVMLREFGYHSAVRTNVDVTTADMFISTIGSPSSPSTSRRNDYSWFAATACLLPGRKDGGKKCPGVGIVPRLRRRYDPDVIAVIEDCDEIKHILRQATSLQNSIVTVFREISPMIGRFPVAPRDHSSYP